MGDDTQNTHTFDLGKAPGLNRTNGADTVGAHAGERELPFILDNADQ